MKYLLLSVLLLTGCYTWIAPSLIENPPPPPVMIANGTDGNINWHCQLSELNYSAAWVKCDFHSRAVGWFMSNSCINVSFYDERSGKLVVDSPTVCSGPLMLDENSEKLAVFRKENRQTLRKCGSDLSCCVMLAGHNL